MKRGNVKHLSVLSVCARITVKIFYCCMPNGSKYVYRHTYYA